MYFEWFKNLYENLRTHHSRWKAKTTSPTFIIIIFGAPFVEFYFKNFVWNFVYPALLFNAQNVSMERRHQLREKHNTSFEMKISMKRFKNIINTNKN